MAGRKAGKTGVVVAASVSEIADRLAAHQLEILGGFQAEGDPGLPPLTKTLLMIGPKEPGFWPHLTAQPEWDGAPDPMDRWSRRVIGRMACDLGAKALFPFGGPPYHPFYQWALRTGRVWDSPVRLLVQAEQGLLVSFRGALALKQRVERLLWRLTCSLAGVSSANRSPARRSLNQRTVAWMTPRPWTDRRTSSPSIRVVGTSIWQPS